jgi:hypothetical protein
MRILFSLLVFTVVLFSNPFAARADYSQDIPIDQLIIRENTTWTGETIIPEGVNEIIVEGTATLIIEAGTVLEFPNPVALIVLGGLQSGNLNGLPVELKNVAVTLQDLKDPTSYIYNTIFDSSITIKNSSPTATNVKKAFPAIEKAIFNGPNINQTETYALQLENISAPVNESLIRGQLNTIKYAGYLSNNYFGPEGGIVASGEKPKIFNNTFEENEIAIKLLNDTFARIYRNNFLKCKIAISIRDSTEARIIYNQFSDTQISVNFDSSNKLFFRANNLNASIPATGISTTIIDPVIDLEDNWWGNPLGPVNNKIPANKENLNDEPPENPPLVTNIGVTFPQLILENPYEFVSPGDLLINEVFPYPLNSIDGEWVEIFNKLERDVVVYDFQIADATSEDYIEQIACPARGYILIASHPDNLKAIYPNNTASVYPLSTIGSGLNNDEDIVSISYHGLINADRSEYARMVKNKSYSRYKSGWQIVNTATPGFENHPLPPIIPEPPKPIENPSQPAVNEGPNSIKINQLTDYLGKLVRITGLVENPQGNTFYIRDDTGLVKVYLRPSYNITKPRFSKGIRVKVEGIADKYAGVLRILPQKTGDIEIISAENFENQEEETNNTILEKIIPEAKAAEPELENNNPIITSSISSPKVKSVKQASDLKPQSQLLLLKIFLLCAIIGLLSLIAFSAWRRNVNRNAQP